MGFLKSVYEDAEITVQLTPAYWVRLRPMKTREALAIGRGATDDDERAARLIAASISAWNLDDEQGEPLPLPCSSEFIGDLPEPAFIKLAKARAEMEGEAPDPNFRGTAASSAPDGGLAGGASHPDPVLDGAGVLAATGSSLT